jgi:hypothetical protein
VRASYQNLDGEPTAVRVDVTRSPGTSAPAGTPPPSP